MMIGRTHSKSTVLLVVIVTVISNLFLVTPALARDNRNEVRDNASIGGWKLITVKWLNHLDYAKLAAKLATPVGVAGEMAAESAKVYVELYDLLKSESQAKMVLKLLTDSLSSGSSSSVQLEGIEAKVMLLTYRHWHDEKVPYCDLSGCRMRWVEIPEPNTHELVLAVRGRLVGGGTNPAGGVITLQNNGNFEKKYWYLDIDGNTGEVLLWPTLGSGGRWRMIEHGNGTVSLQVTANVEWKNWYLDVDGETGKALLWPNLFSGGYWTVTQTNK